MKSFWKAESLCGPRYIAAYGSEGMALVEGLVEKKGQLSRCQAHNGHVSDIPTQRTLTPNIAAALVGGTRSRSTPSWGFTGTIACHPPMMLSPFNSSKKQTS